jgi:DNA-directed RNA polymerase subunit RPC12/RpoP
MASMSQYHCDKCSKEFPSLAELDYHMISKHTGQLNHS